MSRIHFAGFCGQAFRSKDAPPKREMHTHFTGTLIYKVMFCTISDFATVCNMSKHFPSFMNVSYKTLEV